MTGADLAYFGQKDAQQLLLIRRMVQDLDFPVDVVAVPTVREPDGLAMSSRNMYLTASDRESAQSLSRALTVGAAAAAEGPSAVRRAARAVHEPALAGRPVRDLTRASRAAAGRLGGEEPGVDEGADVVQHAGRVPSQTGGDLLVGERLRQAQPQDPRADSGSEGAGLGVGRPALVPAAQRRARPGHGERVGDTRFTD